MQRGADGPVAASYTAITEAFLARHLGGRSEPIGDDLRDSGMQVQGAEHVPGLAAALAAPPRRGASASGATMATTFRSSAELPCLRAGSRHCTNSIRIRLPQVV